MNPTCRSTKPSEAPHSRICWQEPLISVSGTESSLVRLANEPDTRLVEQLFGVLVVKRLPPVHAFTAAALQIAPRERNKHTRGRTIHHPCPSGSIGGGNTRIASRPTGLSSPVILFR